MTIKSDVERYQTNYRDRANENHKIADGPDVPHLVYQSEHATTARPHLVVQDASKPD